MKLFLYDIRDAEVEAPRFNIAPNRLARAARFLKREDRLRCLAAGILLARELNVHADDDLMLERWGKPVLRAGFPHFNLSHAGLYAALVVAERPVGVDIEQVKPFDGAVARRCFTACEQAWLSAQASDAAFYRLWTGKEAVMKATGEGFRLDPASFSVLPPQEDEQAIDGKCIVNGLCWHLTWREIDGHVLCIAETPSNM